MSEKKLASDYFMEGLNCAESVKKHITRNLELIYQ